jgi:pimeloyl-ACP methyl ester carboxylesterase
MAEQALIRDASADARLVTIPACGHLSPLEAPDAVAAALLSLCKG